MKLLIDQRNDVRQEIRDLERENEHMEEKMAENETRIIYLRELLEEWENEITK